MIKSILFWCLVLLIVPTIVNGQLCSSPGKDGNVLNLGGIINTYYPGRGVTTAGTQTIQVGNPSGAIAPIQAGDLLLVIQMQSATIDSTNSLRYGDGSSGHGFQTLNSAGLYEYAMATGPVAGGLVSLIGAGTGQGLMNTYSSGSAGGGLGQRSFQVIRVPQYYNAQITSSLTCPFWDGSVGGILALDIAGTLDLNSSTVDLSGRGFRGGAGISLRGSGPSVGRANTDYVTRSTTLTNGSKGEGIAGTPKFVYSQALAAVQTNTVEGYPGGSFARGAPANSGGGGTDGDVATNTQNSGGGGGANQGAGGMGGNSWTSNLPIGGLGGAAVGTTTRLFLGGGGGAGSRNNEVGAQSSGGAGGGIVLVRAGFIIGSAKVYANGVSGVVPTFDGGGGGGAGGSIVILVLQGTNANLFLTANGADGANANAEGVGSGEAHGPGGGGGGGLIITSSPPMSSLTLAGLNGTTTTSLLPYGAQSGQAGTSTNNVFPNSLPGTSAGATCTAEMSVTGSATNLKPAVSSSIILTLTVKNNGPGIASSAFVKNLLPSGLAYVSDDGLGTYNPSTGLWTLGSLAYNATKTLKITVRILPTGAYADTAKVSSIRYDPLLVNNTAIVPIIPFSLPIPVADSAVTLSSRAVTLPNITRNDLKGTYPIAPSTIDLDTLTAGIQSSFAVAGQGSFTAAPSGDLLFTPASGFSGIIKVYYTVADSFGNRSVQNARITVRVYPVAVRDTLTVKSGGASSIPVLANDLGKIDPLSLRLASQPFHGKATVNLTTGTVQYTGTPGYSGLDSLTYIICDPSTPTPLCSTPAIIALTISRPPFKLPVPVADFGTTFAGKALSLLTITRNDSIGTLPIDSSSVDLDTLRPGIQNFLILAGKGTFTVDNFGDIRFVPAAGFSGRVVAYYTVADVAGNRSIKTAPIQLSVRPFAAVDTGSTIGVKPLVINVLKNDLGNLDPQKVSVVVPPAHGTVQVDPISGQITYTPAAGYVGTDTYQYTVCDKSIPPLCSNQAVVTIEDKAVIPPPTTADLSLTLSAYQARPGADTISYTVVVTNLGLATAKNIILKDLLKAGGVLLPGTLQSTAGLVGFDPSTQTITWTLDSLKSGASVTLVFSVAPATPGTFSNAASVRSITPDPVITNNSASIEVSIMVRTFFVPKAFTPNGDGKNDLFVIGGLEQFPENSIEIFNRWGNQVYRQMNYGLNGNNWWDGSGLSDGTYYYILRINMGGKPTTLSGYITILKNLIR